MDLKQGDKVIVKRFDGKVTFNGIYQSVEDGRTVVIDDNGIYRCCKHEGWSVEKVYKNKSKAVDKRE